MTGPAAATDTAKGRTYTRNGKTYWSVTTLLKALAKPALLPWGIKSVAEGAVLRFGELAAIRTKEGDESAIRWLKNIPYDQRDRAADLGSAVHGAVEQIILGTPMSAWPTDAAGHEQQFQQFVDDYRPTFEASEFTVYSDTHKYAGTADFVAMIGGVRYLVDVKTGMKGPWPEAALQLSAYRNAEFVGLPDGSTQPIPRVAACAVLKLNPEGYSLIEVDGGDITFDYFLHVAAMFRWQNELAPSVIGEPIRTIVGAA